MKFIKRHLKSNSGDGYISFLIVMIVLLLMFGLLASILTMTVNTRAIRVGVDDAANDVFDDIRKTAYDKLTNDATDFSYSDYSDNKVLEMLCSHLGAVQTMEGMNEYVYHTDARDRVDYKIEDFHYFYLPSVIRYTEVDTATIGSTQRLTVSSKIGDVNGDDAVDKNDIAALQAYIDGGGGSSSTYDLDGDGSVNSASFDMTLLKALVKYHASLPDAQTNDDATLRSSGLLLLSFKLTIPLRFGTLSFGDDVEDCNYSMNITFKPA